MKTNEYLADLLMTAQSSAHGDLRKKLTRQLAELGAQLDLLTPETTATAAAAIAAGIEQKKQAVRATVAEAGRLARDHYNEALRTLICLAVADKRLGEDKDRIVTPWEQDLVSATSPLAETLRLQNEILAEPPKKKKPEEATEELDESLPSGALPKLYADALGYDSLPRLCATLGLDLDRDDDVLALDGALAGLIEQYGLAQARSEEVGKRARRQADELESHRYSMTAAARPIHDRAEGIRAKRRSPNLPGIPMEPKKAETQPPAAEPAAAPPPPPSAQDIARELLKEFLRQQQEQQQDVLTIEAEPTPRLLADGRVPWQSLRVWSADGPEVLGRVRLLLLGFLQAGEWGEFGGFQLVPTDRVGEGGKVILADNGEEVLPSEAALVGDLVKLLHTDPTEVGTGNVNWDGFKSPTVRSVSCGRREGTELRAVCSHRVLTADEISSLDDGYPAEKIRGIMWEDYNTFYDVDAKEHRAHLEKRGLIEDSEHAEPAKSGGKRRGKRS